MNMNRYYLRVWGDRACFTHPATIVERSSYPVITPTAAAGILDNILWKPEMRWIVDRIFVENPIQFDSVRRNELNVKGTWARKSSPIIASENRDRRTTLFLKNVSYVLEAHIVLKDRKCDIRKYEEMFLRRAQKGQCIHQPYLGCREFVGFWELLPSPEDPGSPGFETIPDSCYLGPMPTRTFQNNELHPHFFHAMLENGVLTIPEEEKDV